MKHLKKFENRPFDMVSGQQKKSNPYIPWEINTNKKELEHLKYYYNRQADFWEWLEDVKGLNNKELFDEFEEWEKQNQ